MNLRHCQVERSEPPLPLRQPLHQAVTPVHLESSFDTRGRTVGRLQPSRAGTSINSAVLLGLSNSSPSGLLARTGLSDTVTLSHFISQQWSVNSISHSYLKYDWRFIKALEGPFKVQEGQRQ